MPSYRAVEAHHGVEVDQAALLILGNLGVRDPDNLAQKPLRDTGGGGDGAAQVEYEAGSQGRGVGVPQHGAGGAAGGAAVAAADQELPGGQLLGL